MEEKAAEILVLQDVASLAVLEEEGLALFVCKTAADAV